MRLFVFFALLAAPAFAQYDAATLQGKQPCTATRTTNCIVRVDTAGRMTAATTLPTNAEYSNGTCAASKTINPANGNSQVVTLTASTQCTLSLTDPASGTVAVVLRIIQASGGSGTIMTSGVKWPAGSIPTITATNSAEDWIVCRYQGSAWGCMASQDMRVP